MKAVILGVALGGVLLGTASCASLPSKVPTTNILMARKDGTPVDPSMRFKELKGKEYDAYINEVFGDVSRYCKDRHPCKVLFFFHGGLNSQRSSVSRASRLEKSIKDSGNYPIFVNWNSSFPSTWWDHVAHFHKGLWTKNRFVALSRSSPWSTRSSPSSRPRLLGPLT